MTPDRVTGTVTVTAAAARRPASETGKLSTAMQFKLPATHRRDPAGPTSYPSPRPNVRPYLEVTTAVRVPGPA